ncbi:hypothetical protein P8452_25447 [Trifolium repens]|nr:hypothetical protein P8452_25447 [Trifolium repens]
MESFYLIDIIQRLGIEHYFAEEIKMALEKHHLIFNNNSNDFVSSHQIPEVALAFRLLREGGYHVHSDLLDNLKCSKNTFSAKYGEDVKGLIALYEASQLSIEGEDGLNDLGYLCLELLQAWLLRHHHDHDEARYVANTLQYPIHYGLSRFMDKSIFINDLKAKNEWNCLDELAKINSSIVKLMNQNEIIEVSKWWKDLGLIKDVKFQGYQPVKWYMWPMACFTDPSFSNQRVELTKPISLIYVIDDIFDLHGTLDQLTLFTQAVNRWEITGTTNLPNFMKISLSALYKVTNDFSEMVYKKHGFNPIETLKKSWVRLLNAFLKEAIWLNCGHLARADEYLNNGIVSTGVHVVLIHAFFLFDHVQGISKETIAILDDEFPNIIYSVAKILRLSDDLEGAKNGDQNGLDGSYLDCYMSEHQDISCEEAQRHVVEMISNEWKCLNQEILVSYPFPSSFTNFCLNAARMVPFMYHYRTNPSLSSQQEHVKSLVN